MAKTGPAIPFSAELLGDNATASAMHRAIATKLHEGIDRYINPWSYPDPNPFPRFRLLRWLPDR